MSIYPDRKDGKLTGRFCIEVQKDGKRLRGRADSFEEAQGKETQFLSQLETGEPIEALRKFNPSTSKPQTIAEAVRKGETRLWAGKDCQHDNLTKLRIISSLGFGERKIDSVTTEDIDELIEALQTKRKIADATINRYLSALHVFFEWCEARGYRTTKLPTFAWRDEDEGRIRWITADEEEPELLRVLRGDIPLIIGPAIRTGMRRSEILTLDKDQIQPGWVHLWETKTKTPRSVPITEEDYDTLRWLVANDRMPDPSKLRYEWDLGRKRMGLLDDPWFVFHACRHTCATRLVQANVNLRVVQSFMGHKRIETTIRYAHINDTMLSDALSQVVEHHYSDTSAPGLSMERRLGQPHSCVGPAARIGARPIRNASRGRGGTGRRAGFRFPG